MLQQASQPAKATLAASPEGSIPQNVAVPSCCTQVLKQRGCCLTYSINMLQLPAPAADRMASLPPASLHSHQLHFDYSSPVVAHI